MVSPAAVTAAAGDALERRFFLPEGGTQVNSRKLNDGEQQQRLLLSHHARRSDATPEQIARKPTLLAAINLCIDESGLDDNEIRLTLGIDAGHWSNIRKGKAGCHFPTNKIDDLQTLCGNEIPLIWQALKRGKGLHLLETEAERMLREERELRLAAENKVRETEKQVRVLQESIAGRFGGGGA